VDGWRLRRAAARAIRGVVAVGAIVLMATGFTAGGPEHASVLLMDTALSLVTLKGERPLPHHQTILSLEHKEKEHNVLTLIST
jgi:hypothetical protein